MSQKNSNPKSQVKVEEPPEMDEVDEKILDKIWDKQNERDSKKSK